MVIQFYCRWDLNATWDNSDAWSQQNQWTTQPSNPRYQVEQQYNIATNNTRSVINKTVAPTQPPPPPPRPGGGSGLFVSETAFPSWDD